MKVLIIEDNTHKYERTVKALNRAFDEPKIAWETTAMSGSENLMENKYDLIIIDMMMPLRKGGGIDPEGGITVLQTLELHEDDEEFLNRDTPRCVSSSSSDTLRTMASANYENVPFILNDGAHSIWESLQNLVK